MPTDDPTAPNAANDPDRLLTAKEVAEKLRVHVSTVYRLGPRLDAQRFGTGEIRPRGFRIPASKVDALMQNREAA